MKEYRKGVGIVRWSEAGYSVGTFSQINGSEIQPTFTETVKLEQRK